MFNFLFIVRTKEWLLRSLHAELETEKWKWCPTQLCPTLCDPMDCSLPGFLLPWDFPGNSTGVGCHFLLQGSFLTQWFNPGLPHCRQRLYPLSHQRSPRKVFYNFFKPLLSPPLCHEQKKRNTVISVHILCFWWYTLKNKNCPLIHHLTWIKKT